MRKFFRTTAELMTYVGQVVTLNMTNGKFIQGRIKSIDTDEQILLLERPFLYDFFLSMLVSVFIFILQV